jgi:hypothetical protein
LSRCWTCIRLERPRRRVRGLPADCSLYRVFNNHRKGGYQTLKDEFVQVYAEHGGQDALVKLLQDDPKTYFGLMRDLFPKEVRQTIEAHTREHIGVSETLALAEEAAAAHDAVPLPEPQPCC